MKNSRYSLLTSISNLITSRASIFYTFIPNKNRHNILISKTQTITPYELIVVVFVE